MLVWYLSDSCGTCTHGSLNGAAKDLLARAYERVHLRGEHIRLVAVFHSVDEDTPVRWSWRGRWSSLVVLDGKSYRGWEVKERQGPGEGDLLMQSALKYPWLRLLADPGVPLRIPH